MSSVAFDGRASLVAFTLACLPSFGCGSDESGPPEIAYPLPGSLAAPSGRGGFRFGAASAATQIEDQNPDTDWYVFTEPVAQGGLGKGKGFVGDASMGYTKALADVGLLSATHLDSYRFSMEWARIEPTRGHIDPAALAHYDAVLDAVVAAGLRPVVTVHHFSSPRWVDDPLDPGCVGGPRDANLCGFGDPVGGPLVIQALAEHAAMLAERYGDRVDDWGTVNEPVNYLIAAYGVGVFPPGKSFMLDAGSLLDKFVPVVRDYLKAHAAIYRAIKEHDLVDADGDGVAANVGLSLAVSGWVPARYGRLSDDPEDQAALARLEWIYHYLLVEAIRAGQFDGNLDGTLDEPLPEVKDTLDWLGLQYYFRAGVTSTPALLPVVNLTPCTNGVDLGACVPPLDPSFCVPTMHYEYWAPGLYQVLHDFGSRWPDLPLVVTESGIATERGERRAANVVRALEQIERARAEGVDVRGYYHWSLFDNFEWAEAFGPRFGLYRVDYDSYERTPTLGADVLGQIAGSRLLSSDLRATYGGDGPMPAEDPAAPAPASCAE